MLMGARGWLVSARDSSPAGRTAPVRMTPEVISRDGIDFIVGVGYAIDTFADHSRDDYWGKSCNGLHLLLKRFA